MPNIPPSSTVFPRPGWAQTLGLTRGSDAVPGIGEARQAAMRLRRPVWLIAQLCGALTLVGLRAHDLPQSLLLAWTVAAVAGCGVLAGGLALGRTANGHAGWLDLGGGALLGAAWAVALVLFLGPAGDAGGAAVRGVAGGLIAATALLMTPEPAAGLAFILLAGSGASAAVAMRGMPGLAGTTIFYVVTNLAMLALGARTMVARLVAEQALTEKSAVVSLLLREFEETGADWLWQTDDAKRLTEVTPRLASQLGRPVGEVEGRPLLALLAGEGWEQGDVAPGIRDLAERLVHRAPFRDLIVPVTVAGERRFWSLSAAPRRDERGAVTGFRGVGTDVTERHQTTEKIDRMARFDALTGLANRAHIIDALASALRAGHRTGKRSTLMLIDLDRFKQVNDTLGHPVGDRLLNAVADRLRALAASRDVCGRLGGDEFAVVVTDGDDRERVEALAESIVGMLSAPYEIEGHILHIGASVGSATSPRDGRTVEALLRNADLALYRAKDDGRGVHRRYEPQLHAAAEQRRNLEVALRAALEQGQLRLVYQPIVEAGSGRVSSFEALLRWTHPELGPIAPDAFLPIAQEARLLGRIGDWVMHTACRDAAHWSDGIGLSVNLAAAQLKDPQLAATIIAALSHSGLDAERLELEIPEQALVNGGDAMGAAVDRLLSLGLRVALTDYGTGQIDGYLRKGRFSTMKIDRSLVRGVGVNAPESVAIVRAIVALADSLGITTVAEGAETRADVDRMQRLGCGRIQGWKVGQPLDAAAAAALAGGGDASALDDGARAVA